MITDADFSKIHFDNLPNGLVPVVVQNIHTGTILMLAFADKQAVTKTKESGLAHFYSRSRNAPWKKGETSGNFLNVSGIKIDCDGDALIYYAHPEGPSCHTGEASCFFTGSTDIHTDAEFLEILQQILLQRKKSLPDDSYVATLFRSGLDRIAQKVGEEAVETVIAAKNANDDDFKNEAADLIFHYFILLREKNMSFTDIIAVLRERHEKSDDGR